MDFFNRIVRTSGLRINEGERVEAVQPFGEHFEVRTTRGSYRTRSVLLTIGRRGTPRRLDVPGEDQTKVVYRMIDPEQYRGQRVLVVGGGDSALEAACAIAQQPGANVVLSYRGESFNRAKLKNRQQVAEAQKSGRLIVALSSQVRKIGEWDVEIALRGKTYTLENDAVIVCVGGVLPTPFLESMGVEVETKYGTA